MKLYQYHYLYKITNLINNKIYIGIHSTDKLDDGYFGSGRALIKAIRKYGKANFKKEILEWFDWRCEALQREAQIVNKEFIERDDNYNLIVGGSDGTHNREVRYIISLKRLNFLKNKNNHPAFGLKGENNPLYGRKHSDETKMKMRSSSSKGIKKSEDIKLKMRKPRSEKGKLNMRKPHPNSIGALNIKSKSCLIDGLKFGCLKDAIEYFKMSDYLLKKNKNIIFI